MTPDHTTTRSTGDGVRRFAGAVLLLIGLHFAVEAAFGAVHAVAGPLSQVYGVAAAALFVVVGAALLGRGDLGDRRLAGVVVVLSVVVLALSAAGHLR